MKTYFRYIETNDNEGETWNAFIKMPATDKEHELFNKLQAILSKLDTFEDLEDSFSIELNKDGNVEAYTEKEVEMLLREVDFSDVGYMSPYFKGEIKESILDLDFKECDDFDLLDEVYKMGAIKEV